MPVHTTSCGYLSEVDTPLIRIAVACFVIDKTGATVVHYFFVMVGWMNPLSGSDALEGETRYDVTFDVEKNP